jgi:hypothetical protein
LERTKQNHPTTQPPTSPTPQLTGQDYITRISPGKMRDIKPGYVTLHFIPPIPSGHHQPSLPRHIPLTHPIKQTHPNKNVPIKNHWIGMKKEKRNKATAQTTQDSPKRRRDQE